MKQLNNILKEGIVVSGNDLAAYCLVVAEEYINMPMLDKSVIGKWDELIQHNNKMLPRILSGVDIIFTATDPYPNQREMMYDILVNKRMKIFKTESDDSHIGMSASDNNTLRAVHDYLGHYKPLESSFKRFMKDANVKSTKDEKFKKLRFSKNSFTVRGEMNTYISHSKLLPDNLKPVLFTEIVGQICTYFTTGNFTDNKVGIMKGIDFDNIGFFTNRKLETRMARYSELLSDNNVSEIPTKIGKINKDTLRWNVLSRGEGQKSLRKDKLKVETSSNKLNDIIHNHGDNRMKKLTQISENTGGNTLEKIYITKGDNTYDGNVKVDKAVGLQINGKIHWLESTWSTLYSLENLLDAFTDTIGIMASGGKWGIVDSYGSAEMTNKFTRINKHHDDIFSDGSSYVLRSAKTPDGKFWWSIRQIEALFAKEPENGKLKVETSSNKGYNKLKDKETRKNKGLEVRKEVVKESGLSRLRSKIDVANIGILSAYRNDESLSTNKANSNKLQRTLRNEGYDITRITGSYIEHYGKDDAVEVVEESWFIAENEKTKGKLLTTLIREGNKYNQDSIFFKPLNKTGYLLGISERPNAFPSFKSHKDVGVPAFGDEGEFFSRIRNRPFTFKGDEDETTKS